MSKQNTHKKVNERWSTLFQVTVYSTVSLTSVRHMLSDDTIMFSLASNLKAEQMVFKKKNVPYLLKINSIELF